MNCEQAKDLILTDYLDGELDSVRKEALESHLARCRRCEEFLAAATEASIAPFKECQREKVPVEAWERLRARISAEDQSRSSVTAREGVTRLLEGIRSPWRIPSVSWSFASAVAVIVVVMSMAYFSTGRLRPEIAFVGHGQNAYESGKPSFPRQEFAKVEKNRQMEYVRYLMGYSNTSESEQEGLEGYGTPEEEYFL